MVISIFISASVILYTDPAAQNSHSLPRLQLL